MKFPPTHGNTGNGGYEKEETTMLNQVITNIQNDLLLASTGIRVGELVKLNRSDVDFENRECIVFGKGNKQRKVYFDARTKIHLQA